MKNKRCGLSKEVNNMKIVINQCFGGFGISPKGMKRYFELKGIPENDEFSSYNILRNDPHLVQVVEEMGEKASGQYAKLEVFEIPDNVIWEIETYDGIEWICERHRTWGKII